MRYSGLCRFEQKFHLFFPAGGQIFRWNKTCGDRDVNRRMELIRLLLETNVDLLESARQLLARLGDEVYSEPAPDGSGHKVGAQFRHVIEFYVCLLDGVGSCLVDYDARARVQTLERSRTAAMASIESVIGMLADENRWTETQLKVRMEDAPQSATAQWMPSSVSRELQAVRSHTIHHFALIAMTLRAWGIEVAGKFGVAPSTLRYREQQAKAAA